MMRTTTPAWILAGGLLAGLSGCTVLFNFTDYRRDPDGGSGSGSGGSGSSSKGSSSGSPSSVSSGSCGDQSSSSSGTGGPGSIQIGGSTDEAVIAMDVDTLGNIVIAGTFKGMIDLGGADVYDLNSSTKGGLFLAKFDPAGGKLWSQLVATAPDPLTLTADIAIDPKDNSIAIAGGFGDTVHFGNNSTPTNGGLDVFVEKLSQQGGILWGHTLGGTGNASATAVAVTSTGEVVITGRFDKDIVSDDLVTCPQMNAVKEDAFVAKLDVSSGKCGWLIRTNSTMPAHAHGVAVDNADNIYVSGAFLGILQPGNPVQGLPSVAPLGDTFLVKYAPTGTPAFAKLLAPAGDATVTFDPNLGDLFLSGSAIGAPYAQPNEPYGGGQGDILVVRYTPAGVASFAKLFGGSGTESAQLVALPDGSGKLVMGGAFQGTLPLGVVPLCGAGGLDAFVAQLDATGTPLAAKAFGDKMDQAIRFVRAPATSPGKIVVAGIFQGTIDIGQGPLTSKGGNDIFVGTIPVP